ncbi:hypothetical protein ACH4U7_35540 [Streptomyces sp. NPDC020845]|uniref:hypothetical protein n=1 Tax=Streptomyces sp. NPDC020845 TaxID=3365096 RepID=UPI00378A1897
MPAWFNPGSVTALSLPDTEAMSGSTGVRGTWSGSAAFGPDFVFVPVFRCPPSPRADSNAAAPAAVAAAPAKLLRFNSCVMVGALPLERVEALHLAREVSGLVSCETRAQVQRKFLGLVH